MGNSCTTSARRGFETTTHKCTIWCNQRSTICFPPPKILPRLCGDPRFVLPPSWMNIRELEKPKMNQSNSSPSHLQQLFLARAATLLSCLTLNCAEQRIIYRVFAKKSPLQQSQREANIFIPTEKTEYETTAKQKRFPTS